MRVRVRRARDWCLVLSLARVDGEYGEYRPSRVVSRQSSRGRTDGRTGLGSNHVERSSASASASASVRATDGRTDGRATVGMPSRASASASRLCCRAECEGVGTRRCSECRGAFYCGHECQLADWRARHRASCGACARCGTRPASADDACEGMTGGRHAEMDLAWSGTTIEGYAAVSTYFCGRCRQTIERTVKDGVERQVGGPVTCAPMGKHCMHEALLPPKDAHAACKEYVVLIPSKKHREISGMDAQRALDDAPEDAETIVIRSIGGYCDDVALTFPKKTYPKLKNLRIRDVDMASLTLTEETCPALICIETQNGLNDCAASGRLKIAVPTLRKVSMHFYQGPQRIIQEMIDATRELQIFDSYKLWLEPSDDDSTGPASLRFYSPLLRSLNLHRADGLEQLTLWTPQLLELVLNACFDLQDVNFVSPPEWLLDRMGATDAQRQMWRGPYGPDPVEVLRSLGLPAELASKQPMTPLRVDVANANIGARALLELRKHPRVDPRDLAHVT